MGQWYFRSGSIQTFSAPLVLWNGTKQSQLHCVYFQCRCGVQKCYNSAAGDWKWKWTSYAYGCLQITQETLCHTAQRDCVAHASRTGPRTQKSQRAKILFCKDKMSISWLHPSAAPPPSMTFSNLAYCTAFSKNIATTVNNTWILLWKRQEKNVNKIHRTKHRLLRHQHAFLQSGENAEGNKVPKSQLCHHPMFRLPRFTLAWY